MWFQVPATSAKFLSVALKTLAEQSRIAVDTICAYSELRAAVAVLETTRGQCEALADELAKSPPDRLFHLIEARVSLVLDALDAVPAGAESRALKQFFGRWLNREQFLLVPDVDDLVEESRPSASQPS